MYRYHISAGGIVYRPGNLGCEVAVMYRRRTRSYHLPKGTRKSEESLRETAIREIREETGCQVEVERYLGKLYSQFIRQEELVDKKTYYYLTRFVSGECSNHDHEHDKVWFVGVDEALALFKKNLTNKCNERELLILNKFKETFSGLKKGFKHGNLGSSAGL